VNKKNENLAKSATALQNGDADEKSQDEKIDDDMGDEE
jgi:hypothetical protein